MRRRCVRRVVLSSRPVRTPRPFPAWPITSSHTKIQAPVVMYCSRTKAKRTSQIPPMHASVKGKACCRFRGAKTHPEVWVSSWSLLIVSQSRASMQPPHHCRADRDRDWPLVFHLPSSVICVRPSIARQPDSLAADHVLHSSSRYSSDVQGQGPPRTSRCCQRRPRFRLPSLSLFVAVGVGVGVGIKGNAVHIPRSMLNPWPTRPREHRLRSPSPCVPRPSRASSLHPVPTPTPVCLRCQP